MNRPHGASASGLRSIVYLSGCHSAAFHPNSFNLPGVALCCCCLPCGFRPGLLLPGVSLFGLYQFGPTEMRTLKVAVVEELVENSSMTEEEAQSWGRALSFHHQWMVLSREHAAALVHHAREIMMVRHAPQERAKARPVCDMQGLSCQDTSATLSVSPCLVCIAAQGYSTLQTTSHVRMHLLRRPVVGGQPL